MQQSNVIAGVLFVAYIIFITLRGELPAYIQIFIGGKASTSPPPNAKTSGLNGTMFAAPPKQGQ